MTRWADLTTADPDLAAAVRRCFAVGRHATMATLRHDGSPRISGTEVDFADDGGLHVAMMPGTRRAADLRRDPRLALHCPTLDPPEDAPEAWLGDAKVDAVAEEVEGDRFHLALTRVTWTRVVGGALAITSWTPGEGATTVHRD